MQVEYKINPRKIGLILAVIAVYLAVQSIISEYLIEMKMVGDSGSVLSLLLDTLSVNSEETIPTWFSVSILFISSALLAVIALAKRSAKDRFSIYWTGLALIFLYLSMDEGAAIHEIFADPLQKAFHTTGFLAFGWQILAIPLVIIFGLLYLRFLLHLPPRIRNLLIVAGVPYVVGAVVGDAVGANEWASGGITLLYLTTGTVEELMEMLGVVIFIYALLSYITEMQYIFVLSSQPRAPQLSSTDVAAVVPQDQAVRPTNTSSGLLSRISPAALVIVLLLGTNFALLYWVLMQGANTPAVDQAAVPFYQSIADQLQGDGGVIVQMSGTFSPDNVAARRIAGSLLTRFGNVVVVTLPSEQESVFFAGDRLPFDQNSLSELLQASGQDQFVIYDTSTVKLLAATVDP